MSQSPKTTKVLIANPNVISIPIRENREPLIDIKNQTELAFGPSPEIPNNTDYTKMRRSVYSNLVQAQTLLPQGLRFCLYEGYRSISLQKQLFDARYQKVKQAHPTRDHRALFLATTELVSPVINLDGSTNIPPHSTGAAIDIYLIDSHDDAIPMGIHPKDWMTDRESLLSPTDSTYIAFQKKILEWLNR